MTYLNLSLLENSYQFFLAYFKIDRTMTSLRYRRIFCLEFQKIDGTEYLMGSTELAIFWKLLNLEAWNLVGVYKIENK